jgi:hypothetical protein
MSLGRFESSPILVADARLLLLVREEFLTDAPAPGSEIGKTRWEVPHLEPDEVAEQRERIAISRNGGTRATKTSLTRLYSWRA